MFTCELLSGIWIGDSDVLNSLNFMKDNNITIILNCTQLFDFPDIVALQKIRLPFSPIQSNENILLLKKTLARLIRLGTNLFKNGKFKKFISNFACYIKIMQILTLINIFESKEN